MNVVNDVTKCPYCKNVYDVPVVLICCSECICQNHIDEIRNKDPENKFICPFCDENNEINKFPINKKIDTLLKSNFAKLNLEKEYHEAKQKCENLKTLLEKVNNLAENPKVLIDDCVADMKLKTDLKREMAKKEIDDVCDRLMNELDTFKNECYENIETIMAEKGYKNKIEEIKNEFDVEKHILDFELFNTDKSTWNSHKSNANLQLVKLNRIAYELKSDLLMHKYSKLDNIINIKDFKSNTNKFKMMEKFQNKIECEINNISTLLNETGKICESELFEFVGFELKISVYLENSDKNGESIPRLGIYLSCGANDEE